MTTEPGTGPPGYAYLALLAPLMVGLVLIFGWPGVVIALGTAAGIVWARKDSGP